MYNPLLQVGSQPAMESLPLVMEPGSRLYTSPVVGSHKRNQTMTEHWKTCRDLVGIGSAWAHSCPRQPNHPACCLVRKVGEA